MSDEEKVDIGAQAVAAAAAAPALTEAQVRAGLGVVGKHPILLKHTFLELKVVGQGVGDVSALQQYPHLAYLDLSQNAVTDVSVLSQLPTLVQLNLSGNQLEQCLDYSLVRCDQDNAWAQGDTSVGSQLTNADLSHNRICSLGRSLAAHPFLEVLLLSHNNIESVSGLSSLALLRVLDLSHNKLTSTAGLENLQCSELSLGYNSIADMRGLETCSKLSSLDVRGNKVRTLAALQQCTQLMWLDLRDNCVQHLRQCSFLRELQWLSTLLLVGNPCSSKQLYRRKVVRHLPALRKLDESEVTPEERIETANLFGLPGGDQEARRDIFAKHFGQNKPFLLDPPLEDDERHVTDEELQAV